jgi:hypothetical protein
LRARGLDLIKIASVNNLARKKCAEVGRAKSATMGEILDGDRASSFEFERHENFGSPMVIEGSMGIVFPRIKGQTSLNVMLVIEIYEYLGALSSKDDIRFDLCRK